MSSVFDTITISSLNDDVIALQIDLSHLLRALKSTENASSITVRLMKKNELPTLSFEITLSDVSKTLQDVPVSLQSMKRLEEVCEPDLPEPQVFKQPYVLYAVFKDPSFSRITESLCSLTCFLIRFDSLSLKFGFWPGRWTK